MNFWAMGIFGLVIVVVGGLYSFDTLTLIIIFLVLVIGYELSKKEGKKKK